MHSRSARGFTLIELMVSMAMASVIATAAIASIMAIVALMKQTERQTVVDAEGKMLGEHLVADLQGLGGSTLRPWHGLALERGWSSGSDRLTYVELIEDDAIPECPFVYVHDSSHLHGDPAACCFTPGHVDQHLILASPGGGRWASVYGTSLDAADCKLHFETGVAGQDLDLGDSDDRSALTEGWLAPVKVRRMWLDVAAHELKRDESAPGSKTLSVTRTLTDGVYDLQFALAYDIDPADGVIAEVGAAADDDEWFGNHASDQRGTGSGRLKDARPEHLRMISVGLLVGAPVNGLGAQSGAVLDGPARNTTDVILRPVVGRAYLRNLNLFF